jgi:Domain of unknown function (DUF2383)
MSHRANDALHDIHTATNDVLKGYREMYARAEPDVQTVIRRLTDMHERHAAEQGAELARLREAGKGDTAVQGTVNKVVVILRDWLSGIDRDVSFMDRGSSAQSAMGRPDLRPVPARPARRPAPMRARRVRIIAARGRVP